MARGPKSVRNYTTNAKPTTGGSDLPQEPDDIRLVTQTHGNTKQVSPTRPLNESK